jgi:hypothetical protein
MVWLIEIQVVKRRMNMLSLPHVQKNGERIALAVKSGPGCHRSAAREDTPDGEPRVWQPAGPGAMALRRTAAPVA